MGTLPAIKRTNKLEDEIQQVQTNLDNTPKRYGTPVIKATQGTTGGEFTLSGTESEDGIISVKYRGQSAENSLSRFEGRVNGSSVVEGFSTAHANAQYWNQGGAGFSFPVRAGESWTVHRFNLIGSQNLSCVVHFTPIVPS